MKSTKSAVAIIAVATAGALAGCAGQPQTYDLQGGQSVTVPKGTMLGGASAGQTTALAQEIADSNNNAMTQFGKVENTQNKELQTSQAALAKLEQISAEQGTGQITLFFAEGSATLDQFQYQRLVSFLDRIQFESRGRKVILVSIGSASAVGSAIVNQKLSVERSQAPLPIVSQYLVNTPHQFFKVSAVGDMYAPKNAPMSVEKRYQSVRIIAAYDAAQVGKLGG
jgi:outer membrane protein OmpA-like peptidoglycan-associated protein